jgi:hypothetical protein
MKSQLVVAVEDILVAVDMGEVDEAVVGAVAVVGDSQDRPAPTVA